MDLGRTLPCTADTSTPSHCSFTKWCKMNRTPMYPIITHSFLQWPMSSLLEYVVLAKHFEEAHDKRAWREALQEEARWVAAPTFPPFSLLTLQCSDMCTALQPTLCVAQNFTYLASVFTAVIPKPTCLLTRPPIIGQKMSAFEQQFKEDSRLARFAANPYFTRLARCIILQASFLPLFPIILFTHLFTDFQRSGEEIPEAASYLSTLSGCNVHIVRARIKESAKPPSTCQ